ncbi:hypothetical protein TNCV_2949201 [Trichonephila clavipes]|nr:hypothetical protein TNCV_2949201 [Trichonephila clavipes]
MSAVGDKPHDFESRSSEEDTLCSPNYHTDFDRFNMHRSPLHGGSSVSPRLLYSGHEFVTTKQLRPRKNFGSITQFWFCCYGKVLN